jgi:hypothetical protein
MYLLKGHILGRLHFTVPKDQTCFNTPCKSMDVFIIYIYTHTHTYTYIQVTVMCHHTKIFRTVAMLLYLIFLNFHIKTAYFSKICHHTKLSGTYTQWF